MLVDSRELLVELCLLATVVASPDFVVQVDKSQMVLAAQTVEASSQSVAIKFVKPDRLQRRSAQELVDLEAHYVGIQTVGRQGHCRR